MWKYIPLTFKNLLRNRRRSVLTILSVTVSLFLVGVLLSIYAAFFQQEVSEEQALRLVTRHRVSLTQALPEYYGERIRQIDGVKEICPSSWFGGTYKDKKPENQFARFAVDPERIFKVSSEYEVAPEQLEAFLRDRQAIAVGKPVAERVGLRLGQRITIKGDICPIDLELVVRAIFKGTNDEWSTFFHREYLQESLPPERQGQVGTFTILARSAEDVPRVAQAVDELFRNSPQPTRTETESAFGLSFRLFWDFSGWRR